MTILTGSDRPDLIDKQLESRGGEQGEPIAVKTPLGWTVHGRMGGSAEDQVNVNFTRTGQDSLNAQMNT